MMSGILSLGGVEGKGVEASFRPNEKKTTHTISKTARTTTDGKTGTGDKVEQPGESPTKRHNAIQRLAMLRAVLIFRKKLDGKRAAEETGETEDLPTRLSDLITSLAFCSKLKVRAKRRRHTSIRAHLDRMLEEGKVFDVNKDGEIPYQMQVDMDMYNEENLSQREKLRHNPSISSELHRFVDTLPRLGDGTFGFETYVQFCISVVKMLTVVISSEAARRIAEDDWMTDSKDGVMMPSLFENGMFELADIWTEGVDPGEYVEFLQKVYENVFTDENLKHLQEVAAEEEAQRLAEIEETEKQKKREEEEESSSTPRKMKKRKTLISVVLHNKEKEDIRVRLDLHEESDQRLVTVQDLTDLVYVEAGLASEGIRRSQLKVGWGDGKPIPPRTLVQNLDLHNGSEISILLNEPFKHVDHDPTMSGKTHVIDMEFDLQGKAYRMWKDPFDEEIERFLEEDEKMQRRRKAVAVKKRGSKAPNGKKRVVGGIQGHAYGPMHVEETTLERVIAGRIFTELHGGAVPYRQGKFVDLLEKGDITKHGIISSVSSHVAISSWDGDGHADGSMAEHGDGEKKERIRDARKREEMKSVLVGVPLRKGKKKKKKNPSDTLPSLRVRRQQAAVVLHEYGHYVKEPPSIGTQEEHHSTPRWRTRAHDALEMMKSPASERKQLVVHGHEAGRHMKKTSADLSSS